MPWTPPPLIQSNAEEIHVKSTIQDLTDQIIKQRFTWSDCSRHVPQVVKATPGHEVSTRPMVGVCPTIKIGHRLSEHLLHNLAWLYFVTYYNTCDHSQCTLVPPNKCDTASKSSLLEWCSVTNYWHTHQGRVATRVVRAICSHVDVFLPMPLFWAKGSNQGGGTLTISWWFTYVVI